MTTQPHVFIVDDDPSIREALEDLLASVDLKSTSFANVDAFLQTEHSNAPSCLVLDVRMPGQSGMDFHQKMLETGRDIPVIFISGHGDIPMSVMAMKRGAVDFLTKPFRDQELLDSIQKALTLHVEILEKKANRTKLEKRYALLNIGEKAVMSYVVRGYLNKQIAAELNVSEITVKVRRANLMQKLKANSLVDLIRMAREIENI